MDDALWRLFFCEVFLADPGGLPLGLPAAWVLGFAVVVLLVLVFAAVFFLGVVFFLRVFAVTSGFLGGLPGALFPTEPGGLPLGFFGPLSIFFGAPEPLGLPGPLFSMDFGFGA